MPKRWVTFQDKLNFSRLWKMFETLLPRASSALELWLYHIVCHTVRHEQPLPVSLPLSKAIPACLSTFLSRVFWTRCAGLSLPVLSGRHHQSTLAFTQGHQSWVKMWKLDHWPALLANQEASSCHWSLGWCSHLGNNKVTHFIMCCGSLELSTGSQLCMLIPWRWKQAPLFHLYVNFCWKTCKEEQNWNRKNFQVLGVTKKTVVSIFTLSLGYPTGCFLRMNYGFKFLHIFQAYDFFFFWRIV